MALKNPGQTLTTGSLQALYTVPAGKQAVVSSLIVNQLGSEGVFTLWICKNGAAVDNSSVIINQNLVSLARLSVAEGWALAAGDVVRIIGPAPMAVNLFGNEVAA